MKRYLLIILLWSIISLVVFPEIGELVKQIDQLYDEYKHAEICTLIEGSLDKANTNKEKGELYWRWTRSLVYCGDIAEDNGKKKDVILSFFTKAEEAGEKAIQFDSANPNTYYWKSSAIGRWGQVKGILDSLFKAKPMQELLVKAINMDSEFCKAYQVLGMLYEALPGWPVSFGNVEYAVSLARKAVDLHEKEIADGKKDRIDYSLYKELAKELYKRNSNVKARNSDMKKKAAKYNAAKNILEKNFYFEGVVNIPNQADREEAVSLVKMIIDKLEATSGRLKYDDMDLEDCRELLKKWGG